MLSLDLTGLNCPLPILKTKKFLATLPSETTVKVITTDPASFSDLQAFCEKTGHKLISQEVKHDIITTIICKR